MDLRFWREKSFLVIKCTFEFFLGVGKANLLFLWENEVLRFCEKNTVCGKIFYSDNLFEFWRKTCY